MFKEITPTQTMLSQIALITGGAVDPSQIAIFEAIALNTLPVAKKGSIYEGAVAAPGLLSDMASYIKAGNSVPLHTMHAQAVELPVGKVFMADLNGSDELRALFYVPRNTTEGADFITKLNTSVIDEVSVGVMAAHMRCSQCGWDYRGADATVEHLFGRECANGHPIGENGTHLVLDGLDRWYELSLVSLGAATNAKIVGRARQILGKEEYSRLAASGSDPEIFSLFVTPTRKEMPQMADPNNPSTEAGFALVASLSEAKATAEAALKVSTTQVESLKAQVSTLVTENDDLKKKVEAAASMVNLKADHDKLVSFLSDATKDALVASGVENPQVPEKVDDMVAMFKDTTVKLHNLLPKGGVGEPAGTPAGNTQAPANAAAFKFKN